MNESSVRLAAIACGSCKWCGREGRFYPKDEPSGYVAWHEWAERKSRTHHQEPCPGCGRLSVWRKGAGAVKLTFGPGE